MDTPENSQPLDEKPRYSEEEVQDAIRTVETMLESAKEEDLGAIGYLVYMARKKIRNDIYKNEDMMPFTNKLRIDRFIKKNENIFLIVGATSLGVAFWSPPWFADEYNPLLFSLHFLTLPKTFDWMYKLFSAKK